MARWPASTRWSRRSPDGADPPDPRPPGFHRPSGAGRCGVRTAQTAPARAAAVSPCPATGFKHPRRGSVWIGSTLPEDLARCWRCSGKGIVEASPPPRLLLFLLFPFFFFFFFDFFPSSLSLPAFLLDYRPGLWSRVGRDIVEFLGQSLRGFAGLDPGIPFAVPSTMVHGAVRVLVLRSMSLIASW